MKEDQYSSFTQLFDKETLDIDYSITVENRCPNCLIMAPHGGAIEPGTSEIAKSVAGADKSLYLFEGLRAGRKHGALHVTSHKYDEPKAIEIAAESDIIVAIHGRKDGKDASTVWVGGLDSVTGENIVAALQEAGFGAKVSADELGGRDPRNICNRGQRSKGVQLEIPRSLRDELRSNSERLKIFGDAIRKVLKVDWT